MRLAVLILSDDVIGVGPVTCNDVISGKFVNQFVVQWRRQDQVRERGHKTI